MTNPIANDSWKSIKFVPSFLQGATLTWLSNTTLSVGSGNSRDSTGLTQIQLPTSQIINAANIGVVNGLDTGALAASSWYYSFLISDSTNKNPAGGYLSLSPTAPALPTGYDTFRLIGAHLTNGSSQLLKFYQNGRYFQWDAPITVLTAGVQTTYTAIDLSVAMPLVNFGRAWLYSAYTPATAGNTAKFQPQGATADWHVQTGQVASVVKDEQFVILPLLASSKPEIAYKVANGSDALTVKLQAFEMML